MANINLSKTLTPTPAIISNRIINFNINWKEVQGLIADADADWRKLRDFQRIGSLSIASYIANKARKLLDPDNPRREIGATGQASKNIFVKKIGSGLESGHQIFEGSYRGNLYIRTGRGLGATRPPARAIVEWLVHKKQVTIYPPEVNPSPWRITKAGGPRANIKKRPPRPWKKDLRQIAAIIGNKMKETGMAHLKKFYPVGQPKYDYYGEIMKDKRKMQKVMLQQFSVWSKVYAKFIKSGQYRRISDRVISAEKA
jgi:hypothetical protein